MPIPQSVEVVQAMVYASGKRKQVSLMEFPTIYRAWHALSALTTQSIDGGTLKVRTRLRSGLREQWP